MELRNTPPKPDISERPTPQFIEDICIALRNVAVMDYSLPNSEQAVGYVEEVKTIYADENTVLFDFSDPDGLIGKGWCIKCLNDELRRRCVKTNVS